MYEQKIIENLREFSAKYQYEDQKLSETCFRAADAIEKLQSQLPKWIPVSERLPEVGKRVLFSYRGYIKKQPRIFIGWYNGKQWDSLFATEYDVTHWMPLPEPPKEETDD